VEDTSSNLFESGLGRGGGHQVAAEGVADHGDGDAEAALHAPREGAGHLVDHRQQVHLAPRPVTPASVHGSPWPRPVSWSLGRRRETN
jgi:hypothetical protein